ncbi:MAG: hypothetical protein U1E09_15205 [Methylococcales bacterium]|nr:hypothetical protein [Methylobacter sp.]MDZ4157899.1 hypothetical protein [Methylococcales bacterium]MDP2097866.1 hypothetical protein [Methylobacter sp.]MDP2426560.1 hypothetical protein [Methylobacter sp.]MDP3056725.1 hypothetical protein [Methylobacter sp.]
MPGYPPKNWETSAWLTIISKKGSQVSGKVVINSLELWKIKDGFHKLLFNELICSGCDAKVWGYKLPFSEYRVKDSWCSNGEKCKGTNLNETDYKINSDGNIEITI